jgi:DNA-directed RNA polymerase subunit K/omega
MIMKQSTALTPENFVELVKPTGNIYESTVVIAKRAKQIALKIKEELHDKLADFESQVDTLEEVFENEERIEISKHYEKQPSPVIVSIQEFLSGEVVYRYSDGEASTSIAHGVGS